MGKNRFNSSDDYNNDNAKPYQTEKAKSKDFIALQNEWYAKLKDDGFQDIEVVSKATGHTDPGLINGSETNLKRRIRAGGVESTLYFYNLMQNYLTHRPNFSRIYRDRFIAREFVKGTSYRNIVKLWNQTEQHRAGVDTKKSFSVFIVFNVVKKFVAKALIWNRESTEGLTYQSKLDQLEELDGGES